ncbi:hypothetical protein WJX73_000197 [Symbiochloris irregularis]|uniref:Cytochrome b561 domain-containing protein n=1 Tax=Symbiochloris irregularis TaxID=706552 RepID=A0AAW1P5B2_9CHLO
MQKPAGGLSSYAGAALPVVVRCLAAFLALSIPILALNGTLFSWHPTFMALGFLGLIGGLAVIELNKILNQKQHFHSWHAIIGFTTVMLSYVAAIGGALSFKKLGFLTKLPEQWHSPVKSAHRWLGMFTWLSALVAAFLMLDHSSLDQGAALTWLWRLSLDVTSEPECTDATVVQGPARKLYPAAVLGLALGMQAFASQKRAGRKTQLPVIDVSGHGVVFAADEKSL